ncbi:glycosyltransferase family 4 protein [Escherichia coli]|uniref:Glycosyltransferase family 4 protein n=3 Tax=Enterobacteriaceae TaxID=543 RepID=A0A8H9T539_ECOLX|nr:glycosyltransferase family 4 protein [Escherichia coli]EFA5279340.1 glycosyltransferase [Escherichia coli]EFE7594274.1 glycosyltransferase family 4 protein [Escherichia coli]EFM0152285.1 glycosyltransferase family 4 protein [Escherichia coli]EFO4444524.1 glycosyltransferase family 4 protein [Escherichia coli]EFO4531086.1 glycosyltransferase family 4 protein [Escherichia coli]
MKIAILVNSLEIKGPVIVAVNLAKQLYEAGEDVTLLYLNDKVERIDTYGIKIKKINLVNFHILREFDIIHSHSLAPDLLNAFQRVIFKNRSITTVHNNIYTDLYPEYTKLKSIILKSLWQISWWFIDEKICISKSLLNQYDNAKKKGWDYVYNSIRDDNNLGLNDFDLNAINVLKKIKREGKIIVGSCAVITERKGLQHLVSAARFLPDKYRIVIVGDGPYKANLMIHSAENIIFFERTLSAKLYMRYFDIYAMTSLSEGFGLAAVEAALEGCHLICSNIDTFKELFGENCSYFELENPSSLVDAIENAELKTGNKLLSYVREKFSGENMLKGYLRIYYSNDKKK